MRHLFSPEGQAAMAATMSQSPLLAFDFDGTLAPIVARPDDARAPLAVARRLERLAGIRPVAVITGRTVSDVSARLGFQPRFIVGSHGAEDPLAPTSDIDVSVLDAARARLRVHADELNAAAVTVEDKRHSIALHYRLAHDQEQALDLIMSSVDDLGPAVSIVGGKRVVNVVVAQAPGKAEALARLVTQCGAQSAVFIGDDLNDEPVFARREPTWLTIKVGRDDPNSQANFCLASSSEVASMLDMMLELLGSDPR